MTTSDSKGPNEHVTSNVWVSHSRRFTARQWVVSLAICAGCAVIECTTSLGEEIATTPQSIEPGLIHLRNAQEQEWSDFPAMPNGPRLQVSFSASINTGERTLVLRQQDVKQQWFVSVNGKRLGELVRDENDLTIALPVPAGLLREGENVLTIDPSASGKTPSDDVRVGMIVLHSQPVQKVLSQSIVEVVVVDADSLEAIPCRITIVDASGALQCLGAGSNDVLAVRPGTAYTSTGRARIALPAGRYTIFAGRGFEYSLAQAEISVNAGRAIEQKLAIRREVPTSGYVCCDAHIHTLTHSGHGDAMIDERMLTLAGEGIELPIATDHNVHIDYETIARRLEVRKYFTPVIGNEVTTSRGHFNIFPVRAGATVPDHKQTDWGVLFDSIYRTPGVKIAILNHARDLHSGTRPFGPALHNAVVGENLDGWPMRFNGMEVVNSGAMQSDVLRLFLDWMGLLNRGQMVTPVGSSDSHDVSRYFVGQGRTYIRCDDRDPGHLDVEAAVNSFLQGRVMVSYGLLAELTVNQKYSCGELATVPDDELQVDVRVLGPHWVDADRVLLFANGHVLKDETISTKTAGALPVGVKWSGSWKIPRPRHDVHLVAIALGPGIDGLYWKTARPYQPTSPDWQPHVIGCSGAVWLDVDGDGRRTPARDYAERLVAAHGDNLEKLMVSLAEFDEAIAAQAAHLLRTKGTPLSSESMHAAIKASPKAVQTGFNEYMDAWRENEIARIKP